MAVDGLINSDLTFFRIGKNGKVIYLGPVTADKVWWYENKNGRIRLQGPLKASKELNFIENGDTIEAQITKCEPRDEYVPGETFARLTNCQIKRKWMLDLAPNDPSDLSALILYVSIICDVELLV